LHFREGGGGKRPGERAPIHSLRPRRLAVLGKGEGSFARYATERPHRLFGRKGREKRGEEEKRRSTSQSTPKNKEEKKDRIFTSRNLIPFHRIKSLRRGGKGGGGRPLPTPSRKFQCKPIRKVLSAAARREEGKGKEGEGRRPFVLARHLESKKRKGQGRRTVVRLFAPHFRKEEKRGEGT